MSPPPGTEKLRRPPGARGEARSWNISTLKKRLSDPFALRTDTVDDLGLVDLLESSADQRKIALRGIGTLGGQLLGLTWNPDSSRYLTDEGGSLTRTELIAALPIQP